MRLHIVKACNSLKLTDYLDQEQEEASNYTIEYVNFSNCW